MKFDLIKWDNILQGIRNIINNGYNQRVPEDTSNNYTRSIMKDNKLICLLEGWYISVLAYHIRNMDDMYE